MTRAAGQTVIASSEYDQTMGRDHLVFVRSEIVVFADRDRNGAAQWAAEAARTYAAQGFKVRVELPAHDKDFNDALVPSRAEAAA